MKSVFLFILLFTIFCKNSNEKPQPKVVKGILDLRTWELNSTTGSKSSGVVNLNGEWEFYWNQFCGLKNAIQCDDLNPSYILVPGIWNKFVHNGKEIGGIGYATYRLKVLLSNAPNSNLALKLSDVNTAYKLLINGIPLTEVGKVSSTDQEAKPAYFSQIVVIGEQKDTIEIILHTSNFHTGVAGFWNTTYLGNYSDLQKLREQNIFLDIFLCGSLFLMGIYHLGLFVLRNKDISTFYFGLFCLLFSARPLLAARGEDYWYYLFPNFPWLIGFKFAYLIFCIASPIFLLFISSVFPKEIPKWSLRFSIVISILLSLAVIVFPTTKMFEYTWVPLQIFTFITISISIYSMIQAIIHKRMGAKAFFLGFSIFTLIIVSDIFQNNNYTPFGFLFFVFSQAFFLSIRFSNAFREVEELSENLEIRVIERTKELEVARKEAEAERIKSEKLLLNILPEEVAQELKEKGFAEPVLFQSVSVLFTDFKGFTKVAETMTPEELIKELDICFVQFDRITERYNLEKLKTIGDSYMCAGGIPKENNTHAIECILAALEIQSFMKKMVEIKSSLKLPYWELRIGIHTGSLVAGVVGEKKFAYDVWGDTVNTASRMESSGTSGRINISSSTYELVKEFFECEYRGKINAKNKGKVDMYYINRIKEKYSFDKNGIVPNKLLFNAANQWKNKT